MPRLTSPPLRVKKGVPFEPRGTIQGFLDVRRFSPTRCTTQNELILDCLDSCIDKVACAVFIRAFGYTLYATPSYVGPFEHSLERLLTPCLPFISLGAHFGTTQGTGLYFSFYDSARYFMARNPDLPIPHFVTTFGCGSFAGICSWACIYPLDLVKAKVQRNALAELPYEKPWQIFRRLSDGGVTKLYRGLGVSATRSLFTHGLMCECSRARTGACGL